MTLDDASPALEWFSQADLLAHLQHDASTDPQGATAELAACEARLAQTGFTTLQYIAVDVIGRRVLRAYPMRELAPASFMRPYLEDRLYDIDPRLIAARQSGLPVAWRVDQFETGADASHDRRIAALAASLRKHAMNCGVIFGLSAPRTDLRVTVSLGSDAPDIDWIDDRVMASALALSLTVHRFAQPYIEARARGQRDVALAGEQEAMLERFVTGFSDQEIAAALRISLHKVNYHVKALQKAFNVENRAQLAYMAARRVRAQ